MLFFILGYFSLFTSLTDQKIKIKKKKKEKKHLEISSFYNSVPKIMIIFYTVPEIWCMMDVIIFHFGPFFCTFTPLQAKKIKIKKKIKKKRPWDIIILHKCAKNHDHMPHCYWDMVHDRWNYFSFWAIFCHFTPLTAQKIKILQKWKKSLAISSFYICVPKIMIKWCMVPEIWCATDGRTDRQMDRNSDI